MGTQKLNWAWERERERERERGREGGREGSSNRFKMNGRESKSKIWKHLKRKKWSELKSWERVRDRETELVRTSVIEWEIKTEREWVRDRETELLRTSVIEWEIKTERVSEEVYTSRGLHPWKRVHLHHTQKVSRSDWHVLRTPLHKTCVDTKC